MSPRIGLVGCVKQKQPGRAPARDLYTSTLFRGRRGYVERTCDRWFILSARHGLVDPDEVLGWYDQTLDDATAKKRAAWSERVLAQLRERLGELAGLTFEAHAGAAYLDFGLVEGLLAEGAVVERPAQGLGLFQQYAFYASGVRPVASPVRMSRTPGDASTASKAARGKYAALTSELVGRIGSAEMGFSEMEALVGQLPASARNHRAWWANDRTHPQARAWLDAGWRVASVEFGPQRVRFEPDVGVRSAETY